MKKKFIRTLIAAAMASTMLLMTACGGNAPAGDTTPPPATTNDGTDAPADAGFTGGGGEGTISVGIWDENQRAGLQTIADLWTAESGVTVQISVVPWGEYWTMLEAAATGGDLPDVFWMHPNEIQRYMDNDMLLDLTDMIAADPQVQMDQFPQGLVELYSNNGRNYGVPKDVDTIALWYNIAMFEEAGIETPQPDWTWEDFYDAAVALTFVREDGSNQWGTSWAPGDNQVGYWNVIYSMGGYVINEAMTESGFGDPNTIRAMEFVERLQQNAMPPVEIQAENEKSVLFAAGSIAMTTEGSWMIPAFRDTFIGNDNIPSGAGVALLPMDAETGGRASIYNGLGWSAAATTSQPENAYALISWFGSEAMQRKQAELGVTMAAFYGVSDDWVNAIHEWDVTPYIQMFDYAVMRPHSRNTTVWEWEINDLLTPVWSGTADLHTVLADIVTMMNTALANEAQ